MSRAPFVMAKAEQAFQRAPKIEDTTIGWRFVNPRIEAQYGIDSMPETAENLAEEFQIQREAQDEFALRSQQRAVAAQHSGFLAEEIVPVEIPVGKGAPVLVENDEHPRADTTLATLAKLKPVVRNPGTVTAGNASGVNDRATALLAAAAAERHGPRAKGQVCWHGRGRVPPRIMGIGPCRRRSCCSASAFDRRFDVIELNEAFAAQAVACLRQLGLPEDADFVNPNGGAIALGHPLGMSGARLALTAAHQLARTGGRRALVTLCVGVGQGVALALERVA
jgi:3-oxoadipyl-CoA thiolase